MLNKCVNVSLLKKMVKWEGDWLFVAVGVTNENGVVAIHGVQSSGNGSRKRWKVCCREYKRVERYLLQ